MQKKLYKIDSGRKLAGVCGGIARYFDLDPTLIRVIWAVASLSGTGVLAYIICAVLMPSESDIEISDEQ